MIFERQLCIQSQQSVLLKGSGRGVWSLKGELQGKWPGPRAKPSLHAAEDWDSGQLWGPQGKEGSLRTKIYSRAKQGPTHVVEPVSATLDSKFPLPQASLVLAGREGGGGR